MKFAILLLLAIWPGRGSAEVFFGLKEGDVVGCTRSDPDTRYHFQPHCQLQANRRGQSYLISYNAQGLRDKDYAPLPPKGRARIYFAGSSALVAPGVEEKDSPPRTLEQRLRKEKLNVEVINGGVEGHSNLHLLVKALKMAEAYRPNIYLLFADQTWSRSSVLLPSLIWRSDGNFHLGSSSEILPSLVRDFFWKFQLLSKFYAAQALYRRWWMSLKCVRFPADSTERTECVYGDTVRLIAKVRDTLAAKGVQFFLVDLRSLSNNEIAIFPDWPMNLVRVFESITPEIYLTPEQRKAIYERYNIPVLWLMPLTANDFMPDDRHLTPQGSAGFSAELSKQLVPLLRPAARRPQ